ncbi:MAG TPA: TonB-dependent receptor [Pyrinomonadaceae bacterium]|nr:TonB-dependent receptor [Pyrinomonadaceae bacterium]
MRNKIYLSFLTILFLVPSVFGQSNATLTGRVTDPSRAPVPGAIVTATNRATNAEYTAATNREGNYVFPQLPPATYRINVAATGFKQAGREELAVTVAGTTTQHFSLEVAGPEEEILITDTADLVERESGAVGTVIDRNFVSNLPLNGRSFQTLIELTPGVVLAPSTIQNSGQFSINGNRTNSNYFTVDGVSANVGSATNAQFYQQAGGTLPALSITGGTNSLASVESVQEFRVQTSSYAAEFGRQPGGQISIVTRSGGNDFNGSVYNYFRNEALDANDWFENVAGRPRRKLRQNNFGGAVGGRLFLPWFGESPRMIWDGRDRSFFFFSYEGLRLTQPQTNVLTARVPSLAARQAAPEPFRQVLNAFPLPNAPALAGDPADTERYIAALSYPTRIDALSIRLDHRLTDRVTLFGRWNRAPSNSRFRSFPSQENAFESNLSTLTVGTSWILSSRVTNDLRVNFSRNRGLFEFRGIEVDGGVLPPDNLLFPSIYPRETSAVSLQLSTGASGVSSANLTQGNALGTRQRQFNIVENLSVVAGSHILKLGADFRRLKPGSDTRQVSVNYVWNTVASRASGIPTSISLQAFQPVTDFFVDNFSLFAQDTWKVTPRLTLTFGLRWELNPPLSGKRLPYQIDGLDDPLTAVLAPPNTKQWNTEYDNFAPRFGIAYTVSDRMNLVLRGGYGIFYDLNTGTALRGYSSFPYNTTRTITDPAQRVFPANPADLFLPPFLDASPPPYSSNFYVFDRNLKLPYSHQWNLSMEKGLGRSQSVTVSYVGSASRQLLRAEQRRNFNAPYVADRYCPAGQPNPPPFCTPPQPIIEINPAIFGPANLTSGPIAAGSFVSVTRNGTKADYHALQAQFQRRLSRGFQAIASYTFSRSMDDVSDETFTGIPIADQILSLERGRSNFDVPHNFTAAATYDIPVFLSGNAARVLLGGWSFDAIFRLRSGLPFSVVTQSFDVFNVGTSRRVDVVVGQPFWIDDATVPGGRRLNPAAFAQPEAGRQGTLGRNSLRSYFVNQVDLAIRRQLRFSERYRLQLRLEAFNAFNNANFNPPASSFGFPGFGVSTAMLGRGLSGNTATTQTSPSPGFNSLYQVGGPRSLQLSARFSF